MVMLISGEGVTCWWSCDLGSVVTQRSELITAVLQRLLLVMVVLWWFCVCSKWYLRCVDVILSKSPFRDELDTCSTATSVSVSVSVSIYLSVSPIL